MIIYTLLAVLFWGLWAFFSKIATKYNHPVVITFFIYLIGPLFSIWLVFLIQKKNIAINWNFKGLLFIIFVIITGIFASIFYNTALTKGSVSIVTTLTSLYPIVTIILSLIFLNEQITITQIIGFVLVFSGAILLNK